MTISIDQVKTIAGSDGNVISEAGDKIGGIGQVYLDDSTGEPSWVTVKTGLFGTSESFVPLDGAEVVGDDLRVRYDKSTIKDAPRIEADGNLSPEEEDQLYSYYGHADSATTSTGDRHDEHTGRYTTDTDKAVRTSGEYTDGDYATGPGRDDAGGVGTADTGLRQSDLGDARDSDPESGASIGDDDAMTRSEERVHVGTQTREAGKARLRKYVVTENVTKTVPVSHEEVRLEREPITDANRGDATSGPAISEAEHEVTLHEETPVVEKEAVPVERVRLDTDTVTDEETVTEDVRKEKIDTDVDDHDRH